MSPIPSREFRVIIHGFSQQQFAFSMFQTFKKWRKGYEWKSRRVEKERGFFITQKLNLNSPATYCMFRSPKKLL